jgi:hypothetical protein
LAEVDAAVLAVRERLRERYGWTHVEVRAALLPGPRIRVSGTVAVARIASLLRAAIAERTPESVELELALDPMPVRTWHELADEPVELWAEHPSRRPRTLATELLAADAPVGLLARDGPATLVRARDGTVGWLVGELGPVRAAELLGEVRLPEQPGLAIVDAARAYLGVRYQLGGTSHARIDCSGLVARAYAAALGLLLPRNSNDQLAVAGGGKAQARVGGQPGDLWVLRSRALGRTHVGILSDGGTVLHASRSRDAVVLEPAHELEADAEWLRRVPWPTLVAWSHAQVGRAHVELPSRQYLTDRCSHETSSEPPGGPRSLGAQLANPPEERQRRTDAKRTPCGKV